MSGFDIEISVGIARYLGVEACFVTPGLTQIIRGGWQEQWDVHVGSMAITHERMELLSFTQPYYATPATFFVHSDNTSYIHPIDLSVKKIGVCSSCIYHSYLEGTLDLPGQEIEFFVENAEIIETGTEAEILQQLAYGDGMMLDAILIASPSGKASISSGLPLKQLGEPVYIEFLAAAVDKNSNAASNSLVIKITEII